MLLVRMNAVCVYINIKIGTSNHLFVYCVLLLTSDATLQIGSCWLFEQLCSDHQTAAKATFYCRTYFIISNAAYNINLIVHLTSVISNFFLRTDR